MNRGIKDLQSFALPLGHAALHLAKKPFYTLILFSCQPESCYLAITLMNLLR